MGGLSKKKDKHTTKDVKCASYISCFAVPEDDSGVLPVHPVVSVHDHVGEVGPLVIRPKKEINNFFLVALQKCVSHNIISS